MPLSPSFVISQSGLTPQSVSITDTSTGSDINIVGRRVLLQQSDGTYLTGNGSVNYTDWSIADISITLSVLTEDIGASITVQWIDVSGNVLYELNNTYALSEFNKQFLYYLVQNLGLKPGTYQDANFSGNIAVFWTNVIAGINAVVYGNDIAACQNCFSRATQMRLQENLYF